MSGRTFTVFDCPVLADDAAVHARMVELQSIYNGPIPANSKPISVATARNLADAEVRNARKQIREWLKSAREWLNNGNREMHANCRSYARKSIEHYKALKVWRDDYVASLPSPVAHEVAA